MIIRRNFDTFKDRQIYLSGLKDSLRTFAVWRDGEQWVNDMRTLKQCFEILEKEVSQGKKEKQ